MSLFLFFCVVGMLSFVLDLVGVSQLLLFRLIFFKEFVGDGSL